MKSPPHYGFTTFPEIRLLRFGSGPTGPGQPYRHGTARRAILIHGKESHPVKMPAKWLPVATHDQGRQPGAAAPWKKIHFLAIGHGCRA